jgi:hypothetical protein
MKQRIGWGILGAGVAALWATAALAQAGAPFIKHTFEEGEDGWAAFGGSAKLSTTREVANVKTGSAALQLDYTVAKGDFGVLILPRPEGALTKMKSMRFWVKSDYGAPLVVVITEKEGGRYIAPIHLPAEKWQSVELAPADFNLSIGPDDPKDANNKLDLDKIENISVADLAQMFAQAEGPLAEMFGVKTGPHKLYLDDFSIGEEALPDAAAKAASLDAFVRPQISWLAIGNARLSVAQDKPISGKALQTDYKQQTMKIMGLARALPLGSLAGTDKLVFSVAATKPVRLIVQVEEKGGGKYNTIVDVPGNSEVKEFTLELSSLIAADDSKDTNDHLDKELVQQLFLADMTGLIGPADQDVTLWIGKLRATK